MWEEAVARAGEEALARRRVPGAAFGDDRYFRISYAYPESTLRDAVGRLAALR